MQTADDTTSILQSNEQLSLTIEGVTESVILGYFETFNAGNFEATSALFAVDGALRPPFEEPIIGPEAIAKYLQEEAKGMQGFPKQGISQELDDGYVQFQVSGKVHTPLFGVNVSWIFVVNQNREIFLATIKLLASPQELLNLRR